MAGWLGEAGIPFTVSDDDAVARGAWGNSRVMVLCSSPEPGLRELLAIRRFLGDGGKAIVFYSASPRLAGLLGMTLGNYATATQPGQWSAFGFIQGAPAGVPGRIVQDSRNIRPAFPAGPSARVIAWWEDASGRRLRDPAWVQSDRGFWMSHILLEGDVPAKKQMLVALLGACDPALWQVAAAHAMREAGRPDRLPDNNRVEALTAQAERLRQELAGNYRQEQYVRVVQDAARLDATLTEAYARTQTPRPGEFRAVWNHNGTGLYPGDWDATCRTLAQGGLTAVFPNVVRAGTPIIPRIPPV